MSDIVLTLICKRCGINYIETISIDESQNAMLKKHRFADFNIYDFGTGRPLSFYLCPHCFEAFCDFLLAKETD